MSKISKLVLYSSISLCLCALANVASARVCFLVGGRCNDNSYINDKQIVDSKVCVGYEKTNESCEDQFGGENGIAKKIAGGGYCSGNGKYDSCVCNPEYYKYADLNDGYEYVEECGGKYHIKRCPAVYKYVENSSILEGALGNSLLRNVNRSLEGNGLNGNLTTCPRDDYTNANAGGDMCTEIEYNNAPRYKSCVCDNHTYRYKTDVLSGYNGQVFTPQLKCKGTDNVEWYQSGTCTGNLVNGYYYRSECAESERPAGSSHNKKWRSANLPLTQITCYACQQQTCTGSNIYETYQACWNDFVYDPDEEGCIAVDNNGQECFKGVTCEGDFAAVAYDDQDTDVFTYETVSTDDQNLTCYRPTGCKTGIKMLLIIRHL